MIRLFCIMQHFSGDCEYYFRPVKYTAEYFALIPLYSFVYFLLFGPPCQYLFHGSSKITLTISLARQLTNKRMLFLKTVIWKENYAEKDLIKKSASGWIPERAMPLSQEMSHPSEQPRRYALQCKKLPNNGCLEFIPFLFRIHSYIFMLQTI